MTDQLKIYLPLILFALLVSTQLRASHEASEPSDGTVNSFRWLKTPAPVGDVIIRDIDGKPVSLSDFQGKIILLNLWASWCPPCIRELPALDRLQERLGGEKFTVLAVSLDKDPQTARELFINRLSITNLDMYTESAEQLGQFFPVDVLPANFILDAKGRAIGMLRSYVDWDDPQADRLFKQLMSGDTEGNPGKTKY